MNQFARIIFSFIISILHFHGLGTDELEEISDFGPNPGNLKMFVHIPETLSSNTQDIPLVVVLHGCSQSAEIIATESGWNGLANKFGFIVLYPEQRRSNNTSNCFNWFKEKDVSGGEGESASIMNMIKYIIQEKDINENQIYIHGLSAGAAMSVALIVNNDCVFQGGAIFAGGPYGYALNGIKGLKMMMNPPNNTPEEWRTMLPNDFGKCVPKLIIAHGKKDNVVDFRNSQELIKQWSSVVELSSPIIEEKFADNSSITRHTYSSEEFAEHVVLYIGEEQGHTLSVDPGDGEYQGGQNGRYTVDLDFFSTYYVARDFGLIDE